MDGDTLGVRHGWTNYPLIANRWGLIEVALSP
jgi:hypothetical protein